MDQLNVFDYTNALLDRYADKFGLTTNYQIAKHLGCSQATIRNYRNHKTKMDPTTCVQVAEALRIDPMMVIAKMRLEAANNDREIGVWAKYAGRVLLATVAATSLIGADVNAERANMVKSDHTSYTLCAYMTEPTHQSHWLATRKAVPTPRKINRISSTPKSSRIIAHGEKSSRLSA